MQFANEGVLEPGLLTPVQSCLLFTELFFKNKKTQKNPQLQKNQNATQNTTKQFLGHVLIQL